MGEANDQDYQEKRQKLEFQNQEAEVNKISKFRDPSGFTSVHKSNRRLLKRHSDSLQIRAKTTGPLTQTVTPSSMKVWISLMAGL